MVDTMAAPASEPVRAPVQWVQWKPTWNPQHQEQAQQARRVQRAQASAPGPANVSASHAGAMLAQQAPRLALAQWVGPAAGQSSSAVPIVLPLPGLLSLAPSQLLPWQPSPGQPTPWQPSPGQPTPGQPTPGLPSCRTALYVTWPAALPSAPSTAAHITSAAPAQPAQPHGGGGAPAAVQSGGIEIGGDPSPPGGAHLPEQNSMVPGDSSADCGACKNCLDKPKFGGPNTRRKACELKDSNARGNALWRAELLSMQTSAAEQSSADGAATSSRVLAQDPSTQPCA